MESDLAQQLQEASEEGEALLQQIGYADTIILNKVDLVSAIQLEEAENALKSLSNLVSMLGSNCTGRSTQPLQSAAAREATSRSARCSTSMPTPLAPTLSS
jgi:G3E family GTPase